MLSDEEMRKRLSYFEKECTRLSDFLYLGIQDVVELRSLYSHYRHALWEDDDLMEVRIAIDHKMTQVGLDVHFSTRVVEGLKRDYQEMNNAD